MRPGTIERTFVTDDVSYLLQIWPADTDIDYWIDVDYFVGETKCKKIFVVQAVSDKYGVQRGVLTDKSPGAENITKNAKSIKKSLYNESTDVWPTTDTWLMQKKNILVVSLSEQDKNGISSSCEIELQPLTMAEKEYERLCKIYDRMEEEHYDDCEEIEERVFDRDEALDTCNEIINELQEKQNELIDELQSLQEENAFLWKKVSTC